MGLLDFLEPEEQVGMLWHRLVGDRATYPDHPEAAVTLADVRPMLAVMFRTLGGGRHVEVGAVAAQDSGHRLTLRQRLGMAAERLPQSSLTETTLKLPERLALFPDARLNRDLYLWLTAFFSVAEPAEADEDPLRADIKVLTAAHRGTAAALAAYPGLRARHRELTHVLAALRPKRPLRGEEVAVEAVVHALLTGRAPDDQPLYAIVTSGQGFETVTAPRGYRPFLPVPLWGQVYPGVTQARTLDDAVETPSGGGSSEEEGPKRNAKRRDLDQGNRKDPLILNRFEKILSLADMVNVNRAQDDEDEDAARKAADQMEEITLGQTSRKASTRLRLDLDLPPEAATGEALVGAKTYPEWDYRKQALLPDRCRVHAEIASEEGADWEPDADTQRLIARVRRQFEALRPRQMTFRRQPDGDELDLESLVRARCDLAATGEGGDQVYQQTRKVARDLSVAVLVDVSLSTDAWIDGRRVLDVEKEALSVLLSGLAACGDENAVFTFTSRRADWVRVQTVKDFDEPFGPRVLRRIAALRPGFYTRIGAAVRHATAQMADRPHRHRLLLVLTDGKPNDIDHYESRFGIEDTRRAILEARRKGLTVFGVTIDHTAQDYFPALFGRGGYAIVGSLARLSTALPRIYQSLSG